MRWIRLVDRQECSQRRGPAAWRHTLARGGMIAVAFVPLAASVGAQEAPATRCADGTPVAVAAGATFGLLRIDNGDVFDTSDPAESRRLYRLANDLHVRTRPPVVERRLLFRSGDPFSLRVLHESERLLRATRYLYDAQVCVLEYHDGVVDVSVRSRDVWTLRPGVSFGRSGGKNEWGISLEDENLLGTGMAVTLAQEHDVDRDSTLFGFTNHNLFRRWLTLDAAFADSSDGRTLQLVLDQPFYGFDTHTARGIRGLDDDRLDSLYDRGEVVDEFRHETSYVRLYRGWSAGWQNGWTRRWSAGVTRDFQHFSPSDDIVATTLVPPDRELAYPFVGFELLRDRFITARNHNQIDRTEDFYLGPRLYGELGLLHEAFGADRAGFVFDGIWSYGTQRSPATQWLAEASLSGRAERGAGLANAVAAGSFELFHRQSAKRLLFASVNAEIARDLDLDNQLLLGGDNGLRGYPLRYAGGDRRVLFTIEQRYFTPWYPFRLFRVGGAAFFDVGRAWGSNPFAAEDPGWLKDLGLGLRLGGSRSGHGSMVHIDLAAPLDGDGNIERIQLVIETKHGF